MNLGNVVQWKMQTGTPVSVGDKTITPQARRLAIRWPAGGQVWVWPTAVLVETDGETERVPIFNLTRDARLGLFGLAAVILCLTWLVRRSGK